MEHPNLPSCANCQAFQVDYDWQTGAGTGQPIRDWKFPEGTPRPPTVKPPCHICPKKSPDRERDFLLSHRNLEIVALYERVQATCGRCLTDDLADDGALHRSLAIVDGIVHETKQTRLAEKLASQIVLRVR